MSSQPATADRDSGRPTLGAMVSTVAPEQPTVRRGRRFRIIAVALLLVAVAWSGYVLKFAHCEADSKFCVLHVAGTRSDIGCEWDSWSCYVTTDGDDPSTHVFLHFGR